jgi:hypothetical protein
MGREGHGATRAEAEVMDLFDAGAGVENIHIITGQKRERIKYLISVLGVTAHEPWKVDAEIGSAALLAALRRHHPERCGAAS